MIRIFNSYVPSRKIVLICGELAAIFFSFLLAILFSFQDRGSAAIGEPFVFLKILIVAVLAFICSHYLHLHESAQTQNLLEVASRIFLLVGTLAFLLAAALHFFPEFTFGRSVFVIGLTLLAVSWIFWSWIYARIIALPDFRERVYLLGSGDRAKRIREAIESRPELGMDLIGYSNAQNTQDFDRKTLNETLQELRLNHSVDRVIVALADRRSIMPVQELLDLRLHGVQVDDGTSLLEKVSGRIDVDSLHPSWMIFGEGFRLTRKRWIPRRFLSCVMALALSVLTLPLIPIICLLIKLTSKGRILYSQERVGLRGHVFHCYKFRTMRSDAEADTGATWASDKDPRITKIGKFLRRSRLDEIPQLWNVLRGDMQFVGPRPERPEFVSKLSQQIPYYNLRHAVRPGITGWAQIKYGYGASVEEAKEKLCYDLYYIRNISIMLDLLIVFNTLRAVIVGRGVR
jgi:sugar transferase (PEP-CTERM system associated)